MEIREGAWLTNIKIQPFLYARNLATGSDSDPGMDAKVYITATVHAVASGRYQLTAMAGENRVSSSFDLTTSSKAIVLVLPMENPRLWWVWDLGQPYLYHPDGFFHNFKAVGNRAQPPCKKSRQGEISRSIAAWVNS